MLSFLKKRDTEEIALTISTKTFLRMLVLIIGTVIMLTALRKATHALTLIFISLFLALALNGPVHWISEHLPGKRKGDRGLATSVSFLIVVLLLGSFVASLVPPLVRQTQSFINAAPHLVQDARDQNGAVGSTIRKYHLEGQVTKFSSQLSDRLKNVSGTALTTATHVGSSIFSMLTILALTFMMLVEGPYWLTAGRQLVPAKHRKDADRLARDMYRVVKGFVNGQVILAGIAGTLIGLGAWFLGVSYPIALAVIVFVCGLIPMVGHTIGAIIVTAVALFHSPLTALIILGYYILYQQIENYLIQPRIQANSTNLSPLLVFMAVVIGVSFSGLLGGLVAIPVMGCLRILVLYYLEERELISKSDLEKTIEPAK